MSTQDKPKSYQVVPLPSKDWSPGTYNPLSKYTEDKSDTVDRRR